MSKELFGQAIVTSIASPATKYFAFAAPLQNGAENILVSKFMEQVLSTLSLTTTGSSGASTFIANVLNIPNYTLAGLGGVGGSGTAGQVSFFSAASTITGDNGFFWDNSTKMLGINTILPVTKLTVLDTGSTSPRGIMSFQVSTDTNGARFHLRKTRGTEGSPTTIVTGDTLGKIVSSGYIGATNTYKEAASIDVIATGTVNDTGTGRLPTYIAFNTMPDSNSSSLTEGLRINADQSLSFSKWKPLVDSTTALTFYKDDGVIPVITIDTSSQIITIPQVGADPISTATQKSSGRLYFTSKVYGSGVAYVPHIYALRTVASTSVGGSDYFAIQVDGTNAIIVTNTASVQVSTITTSTTNMSSSNSATSSTVLNVQNTNSTVGNSANLSNFNASSQITGRLSFINTSHSNTVGTCDLAFLGRPSGGTLTEVFRITSGGNHGLMITTPTVRQQISSGVASTEVYTKYSIPTTTGETINEGTNFGLDSSGNAVWNQLESLLELKIQTVTVDRIVIDSGGFIKLSQGLPEYADDAAASATVPITGLYKTGSVIKIRVA